MKDRKIKLTENIINNLNDIKVLNSYKRYKDYISIRRNLREAYSFIEAVIKIADEISNDGSFFKEHGNEIPFYSAAFFHSIILYARWFKTTDNKTSLKKKTYIKSDSELSKVHDKIIELRDRYIAHYEEDLLGGDDVFIQLNENNNEITISSQWITEPWIQGEINLKQILECIKLVHNKIDSEILPDIERNLINQLNSFEKVRLLFS